VASALFMLRKVVLPNSRLKPGSSKVGRLSKPTAQKNPTQKSVSKKDGQFFDLDLYLLVCGMDGMVHAHGSNSKMIGKNLIGLKDIDGKAFVKERVELGNTKATFWHEYKFTNPEDKKSNLKLCIASV
jgi:signal transduction histidine kinase